MKFLLTLFIATLTVTSAFANAPSDIKRACDTLALKIEKPTLPTQRISIGSIINPLVTPKVYSECTNTYDTGVPDMGNCHLEDGGTLRSCFPVPDCIIDGSEFFCVTREKCIEVPNPPKTVCSNIIACNTYKTHKRFNVCEVAFTLKVPNFIAEPINKYIDSSYNIIESTQTEIRSALPLACASEEVRNSISENNNQTLAKVVTQEIRNQLKERLRHEGEQWLARTGVETVIASIPTGGIGGAAALGTNLADFIIAAKTIADDYVQIKEVKTFADDMNFEISCHPGDWSDL